MKHRNRLLSILLMGLFLSSLCHPSVVLNAELRFEEEFSVFKVKLKTLEFTSDHNLICNGEDVLTAGTRFPEVEWDPDAEPAVNAPITHTADDNNSISIGLTLEIHGMPDDTAYTITGLSSEDALQFSKNGTVSSGSIVMLLTASNPIGKEIRKLSDTISWSIEIAGKTIDLGMSGPHKIYTTLGTTLITAPTKASVPNVPRMETAVTRVSDAISAAGDISDAYTCYPRIVWNVMKNGGAYRLGVTLADREAWLLPSLVLGADCISIARFVRNVVMVMGVSGTFDSTYYAAYYATVGNPDRPTEALENLALNDPYVCPGDQGVPLASGLSPTWILGLADRNCTKFGNGADPGTEGCGPNGLNAFEAALVYTDTNGKKWYFPAGVTNNPRYDDPDSVVQIFQTMVWVGEGDHDGDVDTPNVLVVKKVDYKYTRQPDVNLCP